MRLRWTAVSALKNPAAALTTLTPRIMSDPMSALAVPAASGKMLRTRPQILGKTVPPMMKRRNVGIMRLQKHHHRRSVALIKLKNSWLSYRGPSLSCAAVGQPCIPRSKRVGMKLQRLSSYCMSE